MITNAAKVMQSNEYGYHYKKSISIAASAESVFHFLDDPQRLTAHMGKSSFMMGGSKMKAELDSKRGQSIGARILLRGSFLGIPLFVHEEVFERIAFHRKAWRTIGLQKLIIMEHYEMGFELSSEGDGMVSVAIYIDYSIPFHGVGRVLGKIVSMAYAKWCVNSMIHDMQKYFASQSGSQ